eukprot:2973128-Rhodomonas_salina.2
MSIDLGNCGTRWDQIAEKVPNRTRKEVVARVKVPYPPTRLLCHFRVLRACYAVSGTGIGDAVVLSCDTCAVRCPVLAIDTASKSPQLLCNVRCRRSVCSYQELKEMVRAKQ